MGYWADVAREAYRRALRDVKLDSGAGIAFHVMSQLLLVGAAVVASGHFGADVGLRVLAAFAPLLVYPGFFLFRLCTIPPARDAELRVQIPKLNVYNPVPDTPLAEAIYYLAWGSWDLGAQDWNAALGSVDQAIKVFRQAAFDRKITVWGTSEGSEIQRRIENGIWEYHDIWPLSLLDEARSYMPKGKRKEAGFYNLMVSREQWERAWPTPLEGRS